MLDAGADRAPAEQRTENERPRAIGRPVRCRRRDPRIAASPGLAGQRAVRPRLRPRCPRLRRLGRLQGRSRPADPCRAEQGRGGNAGLGAARFPSAAVHDHARSGRTPPHIVEAILGHASSHKAGSAGVYNRALYLDQRRRALERWAAFVEETVTGKKPATIIKMPKRVRHGRSNRRRSRVHDLGAVDLAVASPDVGRVGASRFRHGHQDRPPPEARCRLRGADARAARSAFAHVGAERSRITPSVS